MSQQLDSSIATSFKLASHFGATVRTAVDLFVIHTAECKQTTTSAEGLESYFSMASTGVSAHYSADENSVEQSVPEKQLAWAAGHTGNLRGIHLELAGWAKETATDWGSPENKAMLALAAELMADVCARWDIPLEFVDAEGLAAGARGVTTHRELAKAFPKETNHTDPGDGLDVAALIELASAGAPTDPVPAAT